MRFYLYMFLVTVVNILITVLMPVSNCPRLRLQKVHLTPWFIQIEFVAIGSRFGCSVLAHRGPPLNLHVSFTQYRDRAPLQPYVQACDWNT